MTLQFVERKGNERKVIFNWHDLTPEDKGELQTLCGNFMEGFLYAANVLSNTALDRPMIMSIDGYRCWMHRQPDWIWGFEWEDGTIVKARIN